MRPPRGFGSNGSRSIQYANPENYISTKHVDSALFAILKLSQLKAAILFPVSKVYSLRSVGYPPISVHVVGRNSAIRSADPEKPTVEQNMKWIGQPVAEIWPFEIFEMRGRSSDGRSVVNIYILTSCQLVLNILRYISYTPLRYVRNA